MYDKIFLIRHGEDSRDHLTNTGIAQIQARIPDISRRIDMKGLIQIAASAWPKSVETAVILAKELPVLFINTSRLLYHESLKDLVEYINSSEVKRTNTIILSTHLEIIRDFPAFFCKEYLGFEPKPLDKEALEQYAALVVIDCVAKNCQLL